MRLLIVAAAIVAAIGAAHAETMPTMCNNPPPSPDAAASDPAATPVHRHVGKEAGPDRYWQDNCLRFYQGRPLPQ